MTQPPDTPKSNEEDKNKDEKESPSGSSGSGNYTGPTSLTSYGSLPEFEVKECSRLVEEVASKTYDGANADDDLDKDLAYNDLLDQRKFIELSDEGKAYWTEMPNQTSFHIQSVKAIDAAVKATNSDLHTEEQPIIYRVGGTTKKKYPDLAVWGKERLGEYGEPKVIINLDGVPMQANSQVIIEFSWSNPLSTDGIREDQRANDGTSTGTWTCEQGHSDQDNSHHLRN